MLFNSYAFIFVFLPTVVVGYYLIGQRTRSSSALWLAAASLFFYAWWSVDHLWLLLASICFNYTAGLLLAKLSTTERHATRHLVLALSISLNLLLLGYYKYANFFLDSLQSLGGPPHHIARLILPVGISFFTFTQIAFLVDVWQRKVREYKFIHYGLFVLYFPHLIAGPILHHSEMMPQFRDGTSRTLISENLSVGLMIFCMGLFKKVVIADGVAVYVDPVFASSASRAPLTLIDSWCGVLAYTFQLYFDFSGYSDMAIGISRMLGIKLPINFYSPYKASSIIEFWRRWHMTLSRFLRDYLYVPLGGNRKGKMRRYVNLMLTMMLGGLWHGASWTYVAWGCLHGCYLVVNHGWKSARERLFGPTSGSETFLARAAGRVLTFTAVVIAWVFFRAEDLEGAFAILKAMSGMNGVLLPSGWSASTSPMSEWLMHNVARTGALQDTYRAGEFSWLVVLLVFVWALPNAYQIMQRFDPALATTEQSPLSRRLRFLEWKPSRAWSLAFCTLMIVSILGIAKESVFLYYQF